MPLWVFGYGSLMWDAGFPVAERQLATLSGHARSFCMWSVHHRGTEAHPGLVLALDTAATGSVTGLALRPADGHEDAALCSLRERELISSAYLEREVRVRLGDGREVEAVAYVVDARHRQYCRGLTLEAQARIIASATGGRGPNAEYLWNTVSHLHELGIPDTDLDWLAQRVRELVT